jgi:hypothetical protein
MAVGKEGVFWEPGMGWCHMPEKIAPDVIVKF